MPIAGPSVQVPNVRQPLSAPNGAIQTDWAAFLHSLQQVSWNGSRSGPTGSRPTSSLDGRWIGMPYYDTTLGKPVFLHSVNPDVWHDGSGAVV